MIDPSQLRLENMVLYNGEPIPIYSIDRGGHTFWRINDIAINKKTGCSVNGGEDVFQPIPVTEDWLKRLGFEMRVINGIVPEWYIACTPPNYKREFVLFFQFGCMRDTPKGVCDRDGWHAWMTSGDSHCFNIKYIHQLQNVYFFITGQELTLKDK